MNITPINRQNELSFGVEGFKFSKGARKFFKQQVPEDIFEQYISRMKMTKPKIGNDVAINITKKVRTHTQKYYPCITTKNIDLVLCAKEGGIFSKKTTKKVGITIRDGVKQAREALFIDDFVTALEKIAQDIDQIRLSRENAKTAKLEAQKAKLKDRLYDDKIAQFSN